MNIHLVNMQLGARLFIATFMLGLEFLLSQVSLAEYIIAVLIVFITSIHLQYRIIHKVLLRAKNKVERLKNQKLGIQFSMIVTLVGSVIMIMALFENTPEQVSDWQDFGHQVYVLGIIFFIAYLIGYNRINRWLETEKQTDVKKAD